MYEAKKAGGNTFMFFSSLMNEQAKKRVETKLDPVKALENDELMLYYQPIFRPDGKQIVSAEALIRWRHPVKGFIPPSDFIPIAEESALVERVDLWVLHNAAEFMQRQSPAIEYLSLNVTGRSLMSDEFLAQAEKLRSMAPKLCLEITERTLYDNKEAMRAQLNKIKSLGYRVSVDDFGTGYSNLSHMQLYPIDIIKVDKSFTDTVKFKSDERPIIDAIFNIANAVNTRVIVEGVEIKEQVEYFAEKEDIYIQGFYFSKPLPENDFLLRLV